MGIIVISMIIATSLVRLNPWWEWDLFIGLTLAIAFLGIMAYTLVVHFTDDKYIMEYSYELKSIENIEYTYNNTSGKFISIFLISYGQYNSNTEYGEYYVLWQKTRRGLEKTTIEKKNVYIIEDNNETPRIEYFKTKYSEQYYYQIYVPENSIVGSNNYKLY